MSKRDLTPFSIYMKKDLRHRIREAAAKHDMEMSAWAVNAIESYLKFVEPSLPRPNPRPTQASLLEERRAKRAAIVKKEDPVIESPVST